MRDDDEAPTTSAEAVDACAHASWHRLFSEHAVPSESLPLPPAFVDFLLSDGVSLASDSGAVRRAPRRPSLFSRPQLPLRARADPLDDSAFTPEEEADEAGCSPPHFPELEAAVAAAIARLGGAVLPKLNWSAPKDAVWLTLDGRLRCTNADEVFLLLKASDTIAHELCHAYAHCVAPPAQPPAQPELVLKKWCALLPRFSPARRSRPPGCRCGPRWSSAASCGAASWPGPASATRACTSPSWRSSAASCARACCASSRTPWLTSSRSRTVRSAAAA